MAIQYLKLEHENAPKEELEKLTLGGLRKAVFDGDVKHGSVMMGQVAGMCKEIRPLKDIFASLIQESQEAVSYTHLAVYKRQDVSNVANSISFSTTCFSSLCALQRKS